jgi:hypothetical protein
MVYGLETNLDPISEKVMGFLFGKIWFTVQIKAIIIPDPFN